MTVLRPHPSRCASDRHDFAAIVSAHEAAIAAGEPTYRDPSTGFLVLTVATHLERGACCEQGCRHCPYLDD